MRKAIMNESKNVKLHITSVEQHKSDFSDMDAEKPTIIDWNNCHTDEQLKQASLEGFIAYAKDKFGVELIPKKSDNPDTVENLFHVMREPTPEEYAAMDELIKHMSYDTGVTFEGLYNHETYVPMSKINEMRSEIKNEVEEISVWENDGYAIGEIEMGNRILDIVDKYLEKEFTKYKTKQGGLK